MPHDRGPTPFGTAPVEGDLQHTQTVSTCACVRNPREHAACIIHIRAVANITVAPPPRVQCSRSEQTGPPLQRYPLSRKPVFCRQLRYHAARTCFRADVIGLMGKADVPTDGRRGSRMALDLTLYVW